MELMNNAKLALAAAGLVSAVGVNAASANSVYAENASTDGYGTYTYDMVFSNSGSSLFGQNGALILWDVNGLIDVGTLTSTWDDASNFTLTYGSWTTVAVGRYQQLVFDPLGEPNDVLITYTGTKTETVNGTVLATFSFKSIYTTLGVEEIDTYGYDFSSVTGKKLYNTGVAEGPSATGATVPLPAAAWAGLVLMGGMGGFRALRKRAQQD